MFELLLYLMLGAWPGVTLVRFILAGRGRRTSILQSWWMHCSWRRTARLLGLYVVEEKTRKNQNGTKKTERVKKYPHLHTRTDRYGVLATVKTLPGLGTEEWNKAAHHLGDAWRCTRVSVEHPKPGTVRIRAVREDPLTTTIDYQHKGVPDSLDYVQIGVDEYGRPVRIRVKQSAGVGAFGVPGSGKTSFLLTLICTLAPSAAVQFIGADGKVESGRDGDYDDVADRFVSVIGDSLDEFNQLVKQVNDLRRWRSSNIRGQLGGKSIWSGDGPTPDWPLVVFIVDECHTYFDQPKGKDDESKRLASVAAENERELTDLIKKGRSVGILVVPATQKGTTDAMPSAIRDQLTSSLCFAVRTRQAAVAALGDAIGEYPEANPVNLQGEEYVGCCSILSEGAEGYIRSRSPYVSDEQARQISTDTAHLAKPDLLDGFGDGPRLEAVA